mmetsp:Transcript_8158/g.17299  ORF Transcript_8158/g.17299 Transcript_8158/m.17299 type:complete len:202 (-) Transcript_8158:74-679(-)
MEAGEATCDHPWYSAANEGEEDTFERVVGGVHGLFVSKGIFCHNDDDDDNDDTKKKDDQVSVSFAPCDIGEFFSFGPNSTLPTFGGSDDNPRRTAFCGVREACSAYRRDCPTDQNSNDGIDCDDLSCFAHEMRVTPFLAAPSDDCLTTVLRSTGEYRDDDDAELWGTTSLVAALQPRLVQTLDVYESINDYVVEEFDWPLT